MAPCGPSTLPASIVEELLNVIIKFEPVTVAESTPTPVAPTLPCGPVGPTLPCGPVGPCTLPTSCVDVLL